MKELLLRVDFDTLDAFQQNVIANLRAADHIEIKRVAEGTLVYLRSDDDERIVAAAEAAADAGIEIMPFAGLTSDTLKIDDALLNQVVDLLTGSDLRIEVAGTSLPPASPLTSRPGRGPTAEGQVMLQCGQEESVGGGLGEGDSSTYGGLFSLKSALDDARQEAHADALEQAIEALGQVGLSPPGITCQEPCKLQYEILYGPPIIDIGDAIVAQPWELVSYCREEAQDTGAVEDAETLAEDELAPCGECQVGGQATVKDSSSPDFDYDFSIVKEVTNRALDRAEEQIEEALQNLPACPPVRCQKQKIRIVIGPLEVRGDRRSYQGWIFYGFYVEATTTVPWRIIVTCSP